MNINSSTFNSISAVAYLVVGFMAGIIVALLTGITTTFPMPTQEALPSATSTAKMPADSGDIEVADQAAGGHVLITSITVPPPGVWVAVEEVNEDGSLGNVLGAQLVGHPASDITVPLLRATLAGQTYAVALYRDDGDSHFSLTSDSRYVDFDTGQPVEQLFKTTP